MRGTTRALQHTPDGVLRVGAVKSTLSLQWAVIGDLAVQVAELKETAHVQRLAFWRCVGGCDIRWLR